MIVLSDSRESTTITTLQNNESFVLNHSGYVPQFSYILLVCTIKHFQYISNDKFHCTKLLT